jgi:hypothetical protein
MYRQGDLLIVEVEAETESVHGTPVPRDERGRIILAEGEATGHAHAILDREAELWETTSQRYLRVLAEGGVALTHEEHATITIPAGDWVVIRQREYVPEGEQQVAD